MLVKIRFGHGPVVTRRRGKNEGAARLLGSALTLTSVCVGSLGVWRLCEDLDLAGQFFFKEGLLSHWQVWLGAASVTQYAAWRLNQHANANVDDVSPQPITEPVIEPARQPKRAAANV